MRIPREGHEDVRKREQRHGFETDHARAINAAAPPGKPTLPSRHIFGIPRLRTFSAYHEGCGIRRKLLGGKRDNQGYQAKATANHGGSVTGDAPSRKMELGLVTGTARTQVGGSGSLPDARENVIASRILWLHGGWDNQATAS
jgi:hypothetical protein